MNSWYPDKTHGHVPCMPCVTERSVIPAAVGALEESSLHREKEFRSFDFADIPFLSPSGLVFEGAACAFALPSEAEGEAEPVVDEPEQEPSAIEKLRAEAKSLDHMILHSRKNSQCEFCLRGRMLSKYHKRSDYRAEGRTKRDVPEKEAPHDKADEFGKIVSADSVIASEQNAGVGGERCTTHVFDHFSGISLDYPQPNRSEDSNYRSLKHFAGVKLNGNTNTVFKSDTAGELTSAASRLCWNADPSLANTWPHNAACERDIRSAKEACRCSHLQAGFDRKMWPLSLQYTSMARSFFESAPIHDYEEGTPIAEGKKDKTKWEVGTGHPFTGVKYPLGALVFYREKGDGIAEPTTKPGIFVGWKLEPGLRYRDVVRILDYEDVRTQKHLHWVPKEKYQKEVYFPPIENIEFPLQNAAKCALRDMTDPKHELRKAEYDKSLKEGALPYDVNIDPLPLTDKALVPKSRHASITLKRLIELGPTPGCKACENGTMHHNASCRKRFDDKYGHEATAAGDFEHPDAADLTTLTSSSSTAPALPNVLLYDDDGDMVPWALVTRLLERSEMLGSEKALEAIRKEAKGLEDKGTWDTSSVCEKSDLIAASRRDGIKVHIGQLMSICSEKFAELEEAFRVLKGRVVFRGDCAKDEEGAIAVYQNLSASPTSITAANANIAYGRIPGHKTTSADAVKAYVQSKLGSEHPTWIRLPRELWPPHWRGKYKDPVVLLVKSLYGHPEAGAHWERHLTEQVRSLGGEPIAEHPSSFFFPKTGLLLTVYVDDFMLSGPAQHHDKFWKQLGERVELEDIGGLGRFLGRHHEIIMAPVTNHLGAAEGARKEKEAVSFNMSDYTRSACDLYESLAGSKPLKPAPTPFVPDGSLVPDDDEEYGELAPSACKVLMKNLWVARLARPDLVRPINSLATKVQSWSKNCDKQLYRLMCYMKHSADYRMYGHVHDRPADLHLALYVDADFAGDREDAYSTNGGWLVLRGPNTYFPMCWVSKKQTAVSRSTTESEVISLAHSLFLEALPMCALWDRLLGRDVDLYIHEDNEATIKIINKGFSAKLRHISRTHKVNLGSIKDEVDKKCNHLEYVDTKRQAADIFTKALDPQKWGPALDMINIAREPYPIIQQAEAGLRLNKTQQATGKAAIGGAVSQPFPDHVPGFFRTGAHFDIEDFSPEGLYKTLNNNCTLIDQICAELGHTNLEQLKLETLDFMNELKGQFTLPAAVARKSEHRYAALNIFADD